MFNQLIPNNPEYLQRMRHQLSRFLITQKLFLGTYLTVLLLFNFFNSNDFTNAESTSLVATSPEDRGLRPAPFPSASTTTTSTTTTTTSSSTTSTVTSTTASTTVPYSCNLTRCIEQITHLGRICSNCCPENQRPLTLIPNTQWTGRGDARCANMCPGERLYVDGTPGSPIGFPGVCCPIGQKPLTLIPGTQWTGLGDARCAKECPRQRVYGYETSGSGAAPNRSQTRNLGERLYVDGTPGSPVGFPGVCCPIGQRPLTLIPGTQWTGLGDARCANECPGGKLYVDGTPGSPIGFPGVCCPNGTGWNGQECVVTACLNPTYRVNIGNQCSGFLSTGGSWCWYDDPYNGNLFNLPIYEQNVMYSVGRTPNCLRSILESHNFSGYYFEELSTGGNYRAVFPLFSANEMLEMAINRRFPEMYLDHNCQRVTPTANLCGSTTIRLWVFTRTPISLLWKRDINIDNQVSITKFPLDPNKKETWYTWHGSNETPLLVHDPKHEGNITSASQLFGNFTFGKNWKNGFEALATMDLNNDGKVSGHELTSLGLWFDVNQDGISQTGEVKPLSEVGVNTLFFTPDTKQNNGQYIYASRGYERVVDGKIEILPSVDWFGEASNSKLEAISKRAFKNKHNRALSNPIEENLNVNNHTIKKLDSSSKFINSIPSELHGTWYWSINDEQVPQGQPKAEGVLIFGEFKTEIAGYSLAELPMEENSQGIKSMIAYFPITNLKITKENGLTEIYFQIESNGGQITKTKAILSADGKMLSGISSEAILDEKLGENSPTREIIKYNWTAQKS